MRLYRAVTTAVFAVAAIVNLGVAPEASAGSTQATLLPPVREACVSSPFGPRIMPHRPLAGTFHYGVDLPAPTGTAVKAVGPGTVIRIQRRGLGGLEILIQHEGFVGIYSHLGSIAPALAEGGRSVYGGERIATVGMTGLTYGPHLYFGMMVGDHPVDPALYLKVQACGATRLVRRDRRISPTRVFARQ